MLSHYQLALCAQLAYKGKKRLESLGYFTKIVPISSNKTGTECYVCSNHEQVVVVFRGTEPGSIKDWATDLQAIKTDFNGVKCHYGFVKAYRSIEVGLNHVLSSHKDKEWYFIGHSLGGALALLASTGRHLGGSTFNDLGRTHTITWGQPRASEKGLESLLEGNTFIRYVNHADIVPRLPYGIFIKYAHLGELRYFNNKGKMKINPSEFSMLLDRLKVLKERIEDHSMDEYLHLMLKM